MRNTEQAQYSECKANPVPMAPVPDMTVEGFTAYLAKYDQRAKIVFRKTDAPSYEKGLVAMAFTERLLGDATLLVVGLE